ncbi:unnamed protein product [Ambrosiozyma monospora]|uniref:Unnamed protein product n=1 Tax=Ambrosiozyma monospora TaxID=43982 RepID=A0ACB5SV45_AMBMO|nr:unnamed protein product [Ambrosiozyma monospora]
MLTRQLMSILGAPSLRSIASNSARFASTSTTTTSSAPSTAHIALSVQRRDIEKSELEVQDEITRKQIALAKENVAIKKVKPTSPGLRWWRKPLYPYLWKGKPYKPLTKTRVSQSGRNHSEPPILRLSNIRKQAPFHISLPVKV